MTIGDPCLFLLPVEVSIMIMINKKTSQKGERLVDSVRGWLPTIYYISEDYEMASKMEILCF